MLNITSIFLVIFQEPTISILPILILIIVLPITNYMYLYSTDTISPRLKEAKFSVSSIRFILDISLYLPVLAAAPDMLSFSLKVFPHFYIYYFPVYIFIFYKFLYNCYSKYFINSYKKLPASYMLPMYVYL